MVDMSLGIILTGLTYIWLDNTSLALTDVTTLTIRVPDTLRATPSDRVGLRDEAGLTGTDGVTSLVDIAQGSGTTGARLTGRNGIFS